MSSTMENWTSPEVFVFAHTLWLCVCHIPKIFRVSPGTGPERELLSICSVKGNGHWLWCSFHCTKLYSSIIVDLSGKRMKNIKILLDMHHLQRAIQDGRMNRTEEPIILQFELKLANLAFFVSTALHTLHLV